VNVIVLCIVPFIVLYQKYDGMGWPALMMYMGEPQEIMHKLTYRTNIN